MAIFSVTRYTTLQMRDGRRHITTPFTPIHFDTSFLTVKEIHNALINAFKVAYLYLTKEVR